MLMSCERCSFELGKRRIFSEKKFTWAKSSPNNSIRSSVVSVPRKKCEGHPFGPCGRLDFHRLFKNINEIFLPKIQDRFDTSVSKIEKDGDEFNFLLRRKCKLEKDGLWTQPPTCSRC